MNYKRIIPCLDVKNGRAVKGVNFVNLKDAGDVVELAQLYSTQGADELALLDITATSEKRSTFVDLVSRVASHITIPLIVGGGISSIDDAKKVLDSGASKISINTIAVKNPSLIEELASSMKDFSLIVAIDVKKNSLFSSGWEVTIKGGQERANLDALTWAKEVEKRGAQEILLTAMDQDGTKEGFAVDLIRLFSSSLSLPIIASGGAGKMEHFSEVFMQGGADAALAASIFHYVDIEIPKLKAYLDSLSISVRRSR